MVVTDHDVMAAEAWSYYKQRIGTSHGIDLRFDLQSLIPHVTGLEVLTRPFSVDEMDSSVSSMHPDKAQGPDGFIGFFMKKCWDTIKGDFYALANDFYSQSVFMENLNSSYITLVPKISSPEKINDYRPISLPNTALKFVSKMVADWLQCEILRCIHMNQYGFIKGRTIHDCLGWSFEYIYQCKASKKPIVILKLDFEKAFDFIEHEAIYSIMR
jgi:hypothetical protein